jgi:hypothetical protein
MKWSKFIPDMTRVTNHEHGLNAGTSYLVFNPAWWRLDRWLFWLFVRFTKHPRARLTFTALHDGKIERFEVEAYEELKVEAYKER